MSMPIQRHIFSFDLWLISRTLIGLTIFCCAGLNSVHADELSREEWFSNLLKDVEASICSQEEFKKCHTLSEEKCSNRVQSLMLDCYGDEIENIPKVIKDTDTAIAAVTLLGKCFEPKFSDDVKDYRRDTEECKIPETEEQETEQTSEDKDPEQPSSPN